MLSYLKLRLIQVFRTKIRKVNLSVPGSVVMGRFGARQDERRIAVCVHSKKRARI